MPFNDERRHIIPRILKRARKLRRPLTPPERKLWARLRNRQLGGFKFRRQHPIGRYVVDFVCAESALIVELDGDSHGEQIGYDKKRTQDLKAMGYVVIRFTNRQVVSHVENVLEMLLIKCQSLRKHHHPSSLPSTRRGEG